MNKRLILEIIEKHCSWLKKSGWAGYDLYDLRAKRFFIFFQNYFQRKNIKTCNKNYFYKNSSFFQKIKNFLLKIEENHPLLLRKLFFVKKNIIPKAMGLYADAFLELYKKTNKNFYFNKAKECLEWLKENSVSYFGGIGWGLPFDWQTKILIKKNTPCGVVTTICGQAFWKFYTLTQKKEALEICKKITKFLTEGLFIDCFSEKEICFSYTPQDKFHIHNANILVAEFLIKIGRETKNGYFIDLAKKAINYTIHSQRKDGAFFYWGPPDNAIYQNCIDNFHTGYILRGLYGVWQFLLEDNFKKSVEESMKNGYNFYINNFIFERKIPKYSLDSVWPVDIHNCAETILVLYTFKDIFGNEDILKNVFLWTKEFMFNKNGFFYFLKYPQKTIKFPFIRWGQAWMFNALSKIL